MRGLALLLVLAADVSVAQSLGGACAIPKRGFLFSTVTNLTSHPSTLSFNASNPDGGPVNASSPATIGWTLLEGSQSLGWTVTVQASAPSFTSCSTVPISAVRVACANANVSGGGGGASCGGDFTLSTTAQTVATGTQGDGTQTYSIQINFTLAESWRYLANSSCSTTLLYTIHAL